MATVDVVIAITGTLETEIGVQALSTVPPIAIDMELDTSIAVYGLSSVPISMDMELDTEFNETSCIVCSDFYLNYEPETIYGKGCTLAKKKTDYTRTRGDTLPVPAVVGLNGNFDISAYTSIKMSTQIADGTIYTVDATIVDDSNGMVKFALSSLAVGTAGTGSYDIQCVDGDGYTFTPQKGIFILEDDLTP